MHNAVRGNTSAVGNEIKCVLKVFGNLNKKKTSASTLAVPLYWVVFEGSLSVEE